MEHLDNIEKLEQLTSSGERVIIIREIEKPPVVKEVKVKVKEEPSNGKGTAGFVLAIAGLIISIVALFVIGLIYSSFFEGTFLLHRFFEV